MIKSDLRAVLNVSALLDISEYEVFRLAYRRWHGKMLDEAAMERYFAAYMFEEVVPYWVTAFARQVEQQHRAGTLERSALGIRAVRQSSQMVYRGVLVIAAILVIMTALMLLAESAAQFIRQEERCILPPCY